MVTVGAVLITKNEEAVLDTCLKSLDGLDEIIILDTGSTDKTCEIARKYTDKVYEGIYTWNDNFAEARNIAKTYCTTDWILSIDADEKLEEGGVPKIREAIKNAKYVVNTIVYNEHQSFFFTRLFKNCDEVFWKGAIHNYLNMAPDTSAPVRIYFGYSPAHAQDPDRALRILKKEVFEHGRPREMFYLAREYIYRKDWDTAIKWYKAYLDKGNWAGEMAEANLQLARAYMMKKDLLNAQKSTLEALRINANFKEAMVFMSQITGPKNSKFWARTAELCNNQDVMFVRSLEKKQDYYDEMFKTWDPSRYEYLDNAAASLCVGKTLDMGCGVGQMKDKIKEYHGFDFSKVAVEKANDPRVVVGDIYKYPLEGYDTYLMLETLEHVKDTDVLRRIPSGKNVVLSVPSFPDESHLRTYTEEKMKDRFERYIDIESVNRFDWNSKNHRWEKGMDATPNYILLVKGTSKPFLNKLNP